MQFKLKNFDIDKFNRDVNASGGPDAQYKRWTAYRKKITEFLKKALANAPEADSVAVFGAGNLNDINMRFLCDRFERIMLSDTDTKSVEAGLKRQKLSKSEMAKVEIVKADYTGAQKAGLFAGLEKLAKKAAPVDELTSYIEKTLRKMEPEASPDGFDIVISCPVYTQLVYTQIEIFLKILHEYGLYEYRGLNKMLNAAYAGMPEIISCYNDLVINTGKDNGLIVLLTDIIEMYNGSAVYKKIKKLEKDGRLARQEAEKLIKRHGIELAQIGCEDFAAKTEIAEDTYTIWPFNGKKEYLIYGCLSKKRI